MKKRFDRTDLSAWLGPDLKKLTACSFSVDEHQAFAVAYRAFEGRLPAEKFRVRFQRGGFRRAGQGILPRASLLPIRVPVENPLPTYHPKLLLSETAGGHSLVVSTGNLCQDDLSRTTNLAVRLDLDRRTANAVASWIHDAPEAHRALCLVARGGTVRVNRPNGNASTLQQFRRVLERCSTCEKTVARSGWWVVAAPFWSPAALVRMTELEPEGRVEAYFRMRGLWDQVAAAASSKVRLDGVSAYELRQSGELPRWHHKVIGWRCCTRRGARAALYLGSANASVCGFFGRGDQAVNWEAGAIWTGGADVWEHARALARAGFSANPLGDPRAVVESGITLDDELGATDTEEIERIFAAHLERRIRVYRTSREIGRVGDDRPFRALGHSWSLHSLRLRVEDHSAVKEVGSLGPRRRRKVPAGTRPQVTAVFRREESSVATGCDVPPFVESTLDLVELDPEPEILAATRRSAIASALAGLSGFADWAQGDGNGKTNGQNGAGAREDVRFPFPELAALAQRRPPAAAEWLRRVAERSEHALKALPEFWPHLARILSEEDVA
jgi:hypothetical protein